MDTHVHVIGIGQGARDLTQAHLDLISRADLLVGGTRQLALFPDTKAQTLPVKGSLVPIIERIKAAMAEQQVVVLASGDPLFYGIGTTLARSIEPARLVIHPNITSIAAAFSAICQPWHDARIISLHGKAGDEFRFSSLADASKVAFLTDPKKDPAFIAGQLIRHELDGFNVCVLECLGDPDREKISWHRDYQSVSNQAYAFPNIVILLRTSPGDHHVSHETQPDISETYLGMADHFFRHANGLITKAEVRAISLSRLKLVRKDHVIWDVGAGSGSVSIEASFLVPWGHVFAIEKNTARIADIVHNIKNFNRSNIKILNLDFPEETDDLKPPDRIFIGGGGKGLGNILDTCCSAIAPMGVIVVNTVIVQSMETAMAVLTEKGFAPELIQVQVSRSKSMPYGRRLEALNPVWIISGSNPKREKDEP